MRILAGRFLCLLLLAILPVTVLLAVFIGYSSLSPVQFIFGHLSEQDLRILQQIRLPRVILAGVIGAMLAMSGAVLQGLFRNPLADPSLIGVTAGASVGASLSLFIIAYTPLAYMPLLSAELPQLSSLVLGSLMGGGVTVLLVYRLASDPQRGTSVTTMLLVGIAVTALAGAANNLLSFFADNELMRRMSLWQMGHLDLADWTRVWLALPAFLVSGFLLFGQSHQINALLLGESEARHLGVNVQAMKRRLIFVAALGAGISTALAGAIAFVGLIVPHIVRLIVGPNHRYLLPASALLGGILLILADLLARILISPAELPVGVVTALLGVPFFVSLIYQQRNKGAL